MKKKVHDVMMMHKKPRKSNFRLFSSCPEDPRKKKRRRRKNKKGYSDFT
jgi:hypothetical protein